MKMNTSWNPLLRQEKEKSIQKIHFSHNSEKKLTEEQRLNFWYKLPFLSLLWSLNQFISIITCFTLIFKIFLINYSCGCTDQGLHPVCFITCRKIFFTLWLPLTSKLFEKIIYFSQWAFFPKPLPFLYKLYSPKVTRSIQF